MNSKIIKTIFLSLKLALVFAVLPLYAQVDKSPTNPGGTTTYTNVLGPRIADPWMIKMGDFYYLTGTAAPGDQAIDWTPIWKSRDMINWSGPFKAYRGTEPHYWASDAYHYRGKYHLVVTCGNSKDANKHYKFLEASSPEGPYTLVRKETNIKRLDPGIFVDTDGKSYLLSDEFTAPLSDDWTTVGTWKNTAYGEGVREGPFVIKHNNRYNVFRAWNKSPNGKKGYEMMMGYSNSIMGNYTLFPEIIYDGTHRPGHGGYTLSPDGTQMWLTGHFWDAENTSWDYRWLMIDYWGGFKTDGDPYAIAESFTENPVPSRTVINGNVATNGKPVNASDYSGDNTPAKAADSDDSTMWIPANETLPKWLEVDLSGELKIKAIETTFKTSGVYTYVVEGSYDRYGWTTIVDQSSNTNSATTYVDAVSDKDSWYRYIRITITSIPTLGSAGIKEFKIINNNDDQFIGYGDPIIIQAESFDTSSGGLNTESTTDVSGGINISNTNAGEWAQYNNITVDETGIYDIEFRVASKDHDNNWKLYDGDTLIASESVGNTNGWQYWQSVIAFDVSLSEGQHNLKLEFEDNGCNFNWIKIYKVNRMTGILSIGENKVKKKTIKMTPNPARDTVRFDVEVEGLEVYSINGKLVIKENDVNRFDTSNLKGLHIVKGITNDGFRFCEKLIVR
ncbi:family 43 glycosylhydrolase [Algibacter amylolyticus]|uniref:Family 43 glycosylhydrolase n=1 Tax=Algibacter amylolyticus TaxID=1608400 RepID=A0A5M7BCQ5_9FLAO|nr:family 43 glycosylhydrolase [Algibacter amylolyticus]KAA5825151.1 family 43 glycosylhydrolase [Algibacter amylolyticus]MBB5268740.1 hypothetical protein [Algibacter amylolyticus]TSJ77645.1 family 43 glycosylhydrolase [Algibacter amylolyticus]